MNFRTGLSMSLSVTRPCFLPRVEKRMAYEKFIPKRGKRQIGRKERNIENVVHAKIHSPTLQFSPSHRKTNIAM